jgi:hypothetical protein
MKRSVSATLVKPQVGTDKKIVYRVNWLRARARAQRWSEEKEIVVKEMEWVVGTFKYMGGIWEARGGKMGNERPGHRAYAARETDRWHKWANTARDEFTKALGGEAFPV